MPMFLSYTWYSEARRMFYLRVHINHTNLLDSEHLSGIDGEYHFNSSGPFREMFDKIVELADHYSCTHIITPRDSINDIITRELHYLDKYRVCVTPIKLDHRRILRMLADEKNESMAKVIARHFFSYRPEMILVEPLKFA